MPDFRRDLFSYASYFSKSLPTLSVQSIILLMLGIVTGLISALLIRHSAPLGQTLTLMAYGASSGLLVISLPAILTMVIIKLMKMNLALKHVMFISIAASAVYSFFIIMASAFFGILGNYAISYVIIFLGNAAVYGIWLIIERFIIGQRRGGNIISAVHPTLNILLYLPLGSYILDIKFPLYIALVKLYAGMLIFLLVSYLLLYLVDKPMKKAINISGIRVLAIMINQWLYEFTQDGHDEFAFGIKTDVTIDVVAFRSNGKYKAVFVNPDIHYGPFAGFGGGIATEYISEYVRDKLKTDVIVLHGAVNSSRNPLSTAQIYKMARNIASKILSVPEKEYVAAKGSISLGSDGVCRALAISATDSCLAILSKAPMVTEDIDYDIGKHFKDVAQKYFKNPVIIDAHNSRHESASSDELSGIYYGSKYASMYENALVNALSQSKKEAQLKVGCAQQRLFNLVGNPKDLGRGYASAIVFNSGNENVCILYLDANNMLPKLRTEILEHVEKKFKMKIEVCTTDTHAVNSIALPSSNVLGRYTSFAKLKPILDTMIKVAIGNMEDVSVYSEQMKVKDFDVWGDNADIRITQAGKEAVKRIKRVAPFIIAAGFILAAWLIYAA